MKDIGNVMILGDSYSTFEGCIPDGYTAYYTTAPGDNTDVCKAEQTWWHQVICNTRSNLLLNCSWSGTTVCHTGWGGVDIADHSFVGRFEELESDGYFERNKIDTFFIFGATNDSWADSPLGELMYDGQTKEDLYKVLPAICYLIKRAKQVLPETRVICILNTELKDEISDCFAKACEKYDAELLRLQNIDKCSGHPTIKGMAQIAEQVTEFLG